MNLAKCEDKVLQYFRKNRFHIVEQGSLEPEYDWRPPIRVRRVHRGCSSDAILLVHEDSSSYKHGREWQTLVGVRNSFPHISIYFAIPDCADQEPLITEIRELGMGLYLVQENGNLRRVQVDRVLFDDSALCYPINPDLQYRNRLNLYSVFNCCTEYLWWLDKHFTPRGFELIYEWCYCHCERESPNITEIKIIGSSKVGVNTIESLRRNFPLFQKGMNHKGIQTELRIINRQNVLGKLHDRYIISDGIAFNVLPVDSIIKGQHGSLYQDENPPSFMNLWAIGNTL